MHRTTLILEDDLYRQVKREAVDRGRSMRVLVEEALRKYLGLTPVHRNVHVPRFGVYQVRIRRHFNREDIYGHLKQRA